MGLEQVLVALSVVMLGAQLLAWRWAAGVENRLAGQEGYDVARLLTQIIGWSTIARIMGILAVGYFGIDRSNADAALGLALIAQLFGAGIFTWAAWRIWKISRPEHADVLYSTSPERRERLESVGVEVDQVGSGAAVAVDDPDPDAPRPGTDLDSLPS